MSKNNIKTLFFAGIFYLEDLSYNELIRIISDMKIPSLISPVHDLDVWDEHEIDKWQKNHKDEEFPYELGEIKKPHVHVIFQLPYPKQPKSSLIFLNALLPDNLQLNFVQPVGFLNLYCRYLYHADNPEKHLYDKSKIVNLNNFRENYELPSTPHSKRSCRRDIMNCINSNKGIPFSRLVNIYIDDDDMMNYIERNAYFVKLLLNSEVNNYADKI